MAINPQIASRTSDKFYVGATAESGAVPSRGRCDLAAGCRAQGLANVVEASLVRCAARHSLCCPIPASPGPSDYASGRPARSHLAGPSCNAPGRHPGGVEQRPGFPLPLVGESQGEGGLEGDLAQAL